MQSAFIPYADHTFLRSQLHISTCCRFPSPLTCWRLAFCTSQWYMYQCNQLRNARLHWWKALRLGIRRHLDQLCKYLNNICARMKNNNSNFMYVIVVVYFTNIERMPILWYTARQWIKFNKKYPQKDVYIREEVIHALNNVLLLVSLIFGSVIPAYIHQNVHEILNRFTF